MMPMSIMDGSLLWHLGKPLGILYQGQARESNPCAGLQQSSLVTHLSCRKRLKTQGPIHIYISTDIHICRRAREREWCRDLSTKHVTQQKKPPRHPVTPRQPSNNRNALAAAAADAWRLTGSSGGMAAQRQRRRQLQRPRQAAQRHGGAKAAAEAASAAEAKRRKGGAKAAVPIQPRWFTVSAQEGATSNNNQGCGITYLSRNLADADLSSDLVLVRCVHGPCAHRGGHRPWSSSPRGLWARV